jgi:TorA maturation chaperone TorD
MAAEQLVARSDLLQLLGTFCSLPTREFALALASGTLLGDFEQIARELGAPEKSLAPVRGLLTRYLDDRGEYRSTGNCASADSVAIQALLTELRTDYTQLFSHPEHPTVGIYECLVLDLEAPLLFVNELALDCERRYRQDGLELASNTQDPADHLGTQLQFLSLLYARAYAQSISSDLSLALTLEHIQAFEQAHLSRWATAFFTSVAAEAKTPAYQALSQIGLLAIMICDSWAISSRTQD